HDCPPQGPDPVEQVKAEATQTLDGQEIGQQRAVEEIDNKGPTADVGPAHRLVTHQHIGAADVTTLALGRDCKLGDGGGVAQAQIEALRTDGRDDVGGLTDECNPLVREAPCCGDVQGKQCAPGFDLDFAKDGM